MKEHVFLVPIVTKVHSAIMGTAFPVWFYKFWKLKLPFVVMSRKRLDNWTFNAIDHAVYMTAREFRGQIK